MHAERTMFAKFAVVAIGMVAGSFIYQAFAGEHWDQAIEMAVAQVAALATAYVVVA